MNRVANLLAVMASTAGLLAAGEVAAGEVTVIKAGPALNDLKVVRDKETGKLRAAEADEIAEMNQNATANGLAPNVVVLSRPQTTVVTRPDGSATIRRSVDDLDSVVAVRGADGKLVMRHKGTNPAAPATQTLPKE